jgi:hypothetical protein
LAGGVGGVVFLKRAKKMKKMNLLTPVLCYPEHCLYNSTPPTIGDAICTRRTSRRTKSTLIAHPVIRGALGKERGDRVLGGEAPEGEGGDVRFYTSESNEKNKTNIQNTRKPLASLMEELDVSLLVV